MLLNITLAAISWLAQQAFLIGGITYQPLVTWRAESHHSQRFNFSLQPSETFFIACRVSAAVVIIIITETVNGFSQKKHDILK